jgi:hypothetical protein
MNLWNALESYQETCRSPLQVFPEPSEAANVLRRAVGEIIVAAHQDAPEVPRIAWHVARVMELLKTEKFEQKRDLPEELTGKLIARGLEALPRVLVLPHFDIDEVVVAKNLALITKPSSLTAALIGWANENGSASDLVGILSLDIPHPEDPQPPDARTTYSKFVKALKSAGRRNEDTIRRLWLRICGFSSARIAADELGPGASKVDLPRLANTITKLWSDTVAAKPLSDELLRSVVGSLA